MSQKFKNNARTRLSADFGLGDTTFSVTTDEGALFPSITLTDNADHFLVTMEDSSGNKEIMRIVDRSGDNFTVGIISSGVSSASVLGRGLDGTSARAYSAGDLVELRLTAGFIDVLQRGSIVFVIDGGGSEITTGVPVKGFIEAPFSGNIEAVRLFADVTGSIEIDIFKTDYAGYDPGDLTGDSIVDITPPTISSDFKSEDTSLTGWTRDFKEGDIFYFNVNSCTTITKCTVSMIVDRTFATS
jgi:hypothetical protein